MYWRRHLDGMSFIWLHGMVGAFVSPEHHTKKNTSTRQVKSFPIVVFYRKCKCIIVIHSQVHFFRFYFSFFYLKYLLQCVHVSSLPKTTNMLRRSIINSTSTYQKLTNKNQPGLNSQTMYHQTHNRWKSSTSHHHHHHHPNFFLQRNSKRKHKPDACWWLNDRLYQNVCPVLTFNRWNSFQIISWSFLYHTYFFSLDVLYYFQQD